MRSSDVLRGILSNNPGVERFTVRRILRSIGSERFDVSLMIFSLPAIVPVPGPIGIVALPTGRIAFQMLRGEQQVRLPRFLLKKTVSRRALAVAIHAVLPLLEVAEKHVRPRWAWVSHDTSRRMIGLFVLTLAVAIGCPLLGFTPFHATSIFMIALGMAEQDGLAVMIGVAAGLACLALELATGTSARALRSKSARWLRKVTKKLGTTPLADVLERNGQPGLARLLRFQWTQLLLLWNPELPASHLPHRRAPRARTLRLGEGRKAVQVPYVLGVDQRDARVRQQPRVQTRDAGREHARDT
jgi:hypothetical protein